MKKVRLIDASDDRLSRFGSAGAVVDMPNHLADRWEVRGKVSFDLEPAPKAKAAPKAKPAGKPTKKTTKKSTAGEPVNATSKKRSPKRAGN